MSSATKLGLLAVIAAILAHGTAWAGPPFMTDDPEPTDMGHLEIYGPLFEASGKGAQFEGATGIEINYGAAPDLQLTIGVPLAYTHDRAGWQWGAGDLEVSAKYRFYHDENAGLQVAAFPGVTLPTGGNGMGNRKVTALLPVWLQKDSGKWSIFGGGGYAINPGPGNRNYWTGGIALSRQMTPKLLIGAELDRQGADTIGGAGSTSLGIGAIIGLSGPFSLLASAGPTFEDKGGRAGFHAFAALGADF